MSPSRIIKKYPNRRLYDTEESRYITLRDIRQLVIDGRAFVVIDKQSGSNITRSVLLQVLSDQEPASGSILSEQFLAQVIRCRGLVDPAPLATELENTLQRYLTDLNKLSGPDHTNPLTSGPQMP